MRKPRPKGQHLIPKFYLENFVDRDGFVWSYNLEADHVHAGTPETTALETNFYSIQTATNEFRDDLEVWLSGVERKAASIYPRILSGEVPTGQERADFAVFISSLFARSPAVVSAAAHMRATMSQIIVDTTFATRERFEAEMNRFDASRGKITPPELRDSLFEFQRDKSRYTIEIERKAGLVSAMKVTDRLTDIVFDMNWFVVESIKQDLITSDAPVACEAAGTSSGFNDSNRGFLDKNALVSVPLSPSRLLLANWRKDNPTKLQRISKGQCREFNRQRAFYAERYVYASKQDLGIRALCRKYKNPGTRMILSGDRKIAPVVLVRRSRD